MCDNMYWVLQIREAPPSFEFWSCYWLIAHVIDLFRSTDTIWSKLSTLKHVVGLSGVASPRQWGYPFTPNLNKNTPIRYDIDYLPKSEGKGQTFLCAGSNSLIIQEGLRRRAKENIKIVNLVTELDLWKCPKRKQRDIWSGNLWEISLTHFLTVGGCFQPLPGFPKGKSALRPHLVGDNWRKGW